MWLLLLLINTLSQYFCCILKHHSVWCGCVSWIFTVYSSLFSLLSCCQGGYTEYSVSNRRKKPMFGGSLVYWLLKNVCWLQPAVSTDIFVFAGLKMMHTREPGLIAWLFSEDNLVLKFQLHSLFLDFLVFLQIHLPCSGPWTCIPLSPLPTWTNISYTMKGALNVMVWLRHWIWKEHLYGAVFKGIIRLQIWSLSSMLLVLIHVFLFYIFFSALFQLLCPEEKWEMQNKVEWPGKDERRSTLRISKCLGFSLLARSWAPLLLFHSSASQSPPSLCWRWSPSTEVVSRDALAKRMNSEDVRAEFWRPGSVKGETWGPGQNPENLMEQEKQISKRKELLLHRVKSLECIWGCRSVCEGNTRIQLYKEQEDCQLEKPEGQQSEEPQNEHN